MFRLIVVNVAHLEETIIGVFALVPDGEIIEKAFYTKEPRRSRARARTRVRFLEPL